MSEFEAEAVVPKLNQEPTIRAIWAKLGDIRKTQEEQGEAIRVIAETLQAPLNSDRKGLKQQVQENREDIGDVANRLTILERSDAKAKAWALGLGVVGSMFVQLASLLAGVLMGGGKQHP